MRGTVKATWHSLPAWGRLAVLAMTIVAVVVLLGTQSDPPQCYTTVHNPTTGETHTYVTPSNGESCAP